MSQAAINAIIVDNEKARNVAAKYIQAVNGELYARGLMLISATQKFAKFLDLQAIPPWYAPYLSLASTALLVAQPELFLAKFLSEKQEAVKLALAIASAAGSKRAKVVTAVQNARDLAVKGKEIAGKVKDTVENVTGAKEAVEKIADADDAPGAKEIAKLDVGKALSLTLVDASRKAFGIWSGALDTLVKELDNRLADAENPKAPPRSETMEQIANRLLQRPKELSNDELSQVEMLFLYELIKRYCIASVKVKVRIEDWTNDGGNRIKSVSYDGLNNNQSRTIVALFGVSVKQGNIYRYPPITDLEATLVSWGVSRSETVVERRWTSNRQ